MDDERDAVRTLMILAMIPILNIFAFSRIGKLGKAALQVGVPFLIVWLILSFYTEHALLISIILAAPWSALLMYGWAKRYDTR